jgi:hypothetical protein
MAYYSTSLANTRSRRFKAGIFSQLRYPLDIIRGHLTDADPFSAADGISILQFATRRVNLSEVVPPAQIDVAYLPIGKR